MQQKYCDQGRSVSVLRITWPIFLARVSCASGGKPKKASIFPFASSPCHSEIGWITQLMSFSG